MEQWGVCCSDSCCRHIMILTNTLFRMLGCRDSKVVSDIPYSTKEKDLIAFFLSSGSIVSLRCSIAFRVKYRLSKREDGEENNGYAFIEFSSPEECRKAAMHCRREMFEGGHLYTSAIDSLMKSNEDSVRERNMKVLLCRNPHI